MEEADGQIDPDFPVQVLLVSGSGLRKAFLRVPTRGCCWPSSEMLSSGPLLWSEEELLCKQVKLMLFGSFTCTDPFYFCTQFCIHNGLCSIRGLSE